MRNQILSVPGKIYPGTSPELVNQPMTQYNDLRQVMMAKPEVLDAVSVLFSEQSGMISEIMMYLDGYYSPVKAKQSQKYKRMEKNIKLLGNHEYTWRVRNPSQWLYKFVRNATGSGANTGLGANGENFYVYLNRLPLDADDIIELADGHTQLMILNVEDAGGAYKCRVRLQARHEGQVVDPYLVSAEKEACVPYNIKPEASEHGSKVRVSFGAWMRNYMTTMRFEWNLTGHAAHTKLNVQWLVYTDQRTGNKMGYWIPVLDYQMMQRAQMSCERFLWNGVKAVNPDGSFLKDSRGRVYYSGDGLYTQANQKLRVGYNTLTDKHLEAMMKPLKLDSLETIGDPTYVCIAGLEFRLQFDKLLRNVFSAEPHVFYHVKDGEMGLKSNFRCYETPLGKFYMLDGNFFDSKANASLYDGFGNRYQSYRGIVINVTEMLGGQRAAMVVSRAGRQNTIGTINGMSNPGPGGALTTTKDVQGKHLMKEIGIALMNPNCLGEFYKPHARRA